VDRSRKTTIACGLLSAALGLFPILMAFGVIAPDQKPGQENAPAWVIASAGMIFVLGGAAVVTQALVGDGNPNGELPATTPRSLRAVYAVLCLAIVAGLATVASWVAFGDGERHCTGSATSFGSFGVGDTFCRGVFGFGAVLTWIILVFIAVTSARRLFIRR
jgi:hypothetical protein